MKKFLKFIKKNGKVIIAFILGICVPCAAVYATTGNFLFESGSVEYDNSESGLRATNVQNAVDEVFQHATDYLFMKGLTEDNPGFHNSIFRGKDVTSYLTDGSLFTRISDGSFDDLYVGDYFTKAITINGTTSTVTWRIAGFDMYYNKGDSCNDGTACKVHHAVIVPDTSLMSAQMNSTNDTTGSYVESKMYTETLPTVESAIKTAFGSSHVLKYRALLPNTIDSTASNRYPRTTGASSGWAWYDGYVNLMNMVQVTGNEGFSSSAFDTGADNVQFPLFALRPEYINKQRYWYWVRDVASSSRFALVGYDGQSTNYYASESVGVRPYFYIG